MRHIGKGLDYNSLVDEDDAHILRYCVGEDGTIDHGQLVRFGSVNSAGNWKPPPMAKVQM